MARTPNPQIIQFLEQKQDHIKHHLLMVHCVLQATQSPRGHGSKRSAYPPLHFDETLQRRVPCASRNGPDAILQLSHDPWHAHPQRFGGCSKTRARRRTHRDQTCKQRRFRRSFTHRNSSATGIATQLKASPRCAIATTSLRN